MCSDISFAKLVHIVDGPFVYELSQLLPPLPISGLCCLIKPFRQFSNYFGMLRLLNQMFEIIIYVPVVKDSCQALSFGTRIKTRFITEKVFDHIYGYGHNMCAKMESF